MRNRFFVALLFFSLAAPALPAVAASEQPTIYTIVPGDTLWGLSKRFLNDPYYWPNLWAANGTIGNPHFIYPGQRVRVYSDRLEVEERRQLPGKPVVTAQEVPAPAAPAHEEPAPTFTVTGGEGFIIEKETLPVGMIVSTAQNRRIAGTDDIVYTDIGRVNGANVGDRFSVYKRM